MSPRRRTPALVAALVAALTALAFLPGLSRPAAASTSGTTTNPLRYACAVDAPTCEGVGTSNSYFNGSDVGLLYTAGFFCDTSVSAKSSNGCEAGANYNKLPPGTPSAQFVDPLYIPVPLYSPTPATQCPASAPCIDHPHTIDLSRLAGALGVSNPATLDNAMLPAHDHVVANDNNDQPEWWPVVVVGVTKPAAWTAITTAKSYAAIQKLQATPNSGVTGNIPTNVFLFFQVLPGHLSATAAAQTFSSAVPPGTAPTATAGTTIDNLVSDCTTAAAGQCENIGLTHDWLGGSDVAALYSQQYFCDTAVHSSAPGGCEVGANFKNLPPGVPSSQYIDPLYIPVPLYKPGPSFLQCPTGQNCIDHPMQADLSRLAGALGASAASLANVTLPGHDHIITTRNGNAPEWWNVVVVGVTSPRSMALIQNAKSLAEVRALQAQAGSGVTGDIPTNTFLWFQTLPGLLPASVTPAAVVPAAAVTPVGAPATGLGGTSTAGHDRTGLLVLAAVALVAAGGTAAATRRRRVRARS